jgi:excisionase family DNA binding protein
MATLLEHTVTPTENDRKLASESSQFLEPVSTLPHEVRLQFLDEDAPRAAFSLPAAAVRLLNEVLKEMAKGNAVTLLPVHAMLATQEAADILNVSRPFLVGLLERGEIRFQRLGSHRRILLKDLMAFKAKTDAAREDAMRQLTEEAQELNMGY